MLKNKKIIALLSVILVIILAGVVMLFVKGMNYSLVYGDNTTVELYLETEFEMSDVQNIITEVFGNDIKTRQINNLNKDILIITKSAQDEQIDNLISKINEKYGLELEKNDLIITNSAKISILDLIAPYIIPVIITAIIIIAYIVIRYKKIGIRNVLLASILPIIIIQLLLFSIYAITRLPINEYTMPISMLLYIITVIVIIEKFEKDLQNIIQEEKKEHN